jgi:RHS repeat-associated protein
VTDARGEVLVRNDYSGYGKRLSSSVTSPAGGAANRYRFGGKEEQSPVGLGWLDFGARMYDADLARWTTPDPLAEKYPGISPYAYCNTNPVNFVDPDGMVVRKSLYKIGKSVYKAVKASRKVDIKKIVENEFFDTVEDVNTIFDSDASGFEKGIAAFDLVTGFGDEAKWLARTVGVSDAIVDGARVVDGIKFKSFTRSNFRDNLGRLTGGIPDGMQAHHTLPYAFEKRFSDIGINIHDPKYGVWLDSKQHNKLSHKYNAEWEKFFDTNPSYTEEQVMEYAKTLMNEIYGQ